MRNRLVFAILIAAALAAAAFGAWKIRLNEKQVTLTADTSVPRPVLSGPSGVDGRPASAFASKPIDTMKFIDLKQFGRSWSAAESVKAVSGKPVAGVVNHHFLAADLMARFFRTLRLSRPDIKRLIIISPDHFRAGRGAISMMDRAYSTPDGTVAVASSSVQALFDSGFATLEDGEMFEREHGIGALVPFIRHEFPAIEIVPIAVRGDIDRQVAMNFSQVMVDIFDDSTFVLVSSDMSHYLSEAQALNNDETTLKAFASLDVKFLSSANDDFVDNGVGLLIMKTVLEKDDKRFSFKLLDHSISSRYGADKISTTSYINGFWTR